MSTPEGTGAGRPLRASGLVLLAVAVTAALIGLVLVATGEEGTSAGPRPAATPSQVPGSETAIAPPPAPLSFPPATSLPTSGPTVGPTSSPTPPAAPDAGAEVSADGTPTDRGEARVYNNSTISGLAARAADDLKAAGWVVVETANYPGGRIPTSTVYYQEGTEERATAEAIGAEFGLRVEPRFAGIANARPGVIVIVTNDYGS